MAHGSRFAIGMLARVVQCSMAQLSVQCWFWNLDLQLRLSEAFVLLRPAASPATPAVGTNPGAYGMASDKEELRCLAIRSRPTSCHDKHG